jgi:hypothetical protein
VNSGIRSGHTYGFLGGCEIERRGQSVHCGMEIAKTDPEHYRDEADRVRALRDIVTDDTAKAQLLTIADLYDGLAGIAEKDRMVP